MTIRLTTALRAGFNAYAATLLLAALLASPFNANHQDFGHSHAPHTALHLHSIQSFLGGTPATLGTALLLFFTLVFVLPLLSLGQPQLSAVKRAFASRAPPLTLIH